MSIKIKIKIDPHRLSRGGWSAANSQYQDVYDAMTTPPSDSVATAQDTMVGSLVDAGLWDMLDVFYLYAQASNAGGDALLDWKQPTGGPSLMDAGKGSFTTDTESWTAYGTNTITRVADIDANNGYALEIVYTGGTPDSGGAYNYFNAAGDLNTNLTVGKTYKLRIRVKRNAGDQKLRVDVAGGTGGGNIDLTINYTWLEKIFTAGHVSNCYLKCNSMSAGEIIYIDQWDIQEWTNATAYNAPTFTALEGFLGNGTTQYINCNWNPSANGVNYTQNSASQIIYVRTDINPATKGHGTTFNNDNYNCVIFPRNNDNNSYLKINNNTYSNAANANGSGMFINTRTAAAVHKLYRNKVAIINGTVASTGVPTHNPYCFAYSDDDVAAGFRADQVSCYAFGAGMDQTAVNGITDAVEVYMDSNGKGVIP